MKIYTYIVPNSHDQRMQSEFVRAWRFIPAFTQFRYIPGLMTRKIEYMTNSTGTLTSKLLSPSIMKWKMKNNVDRRMSVISKESSQRIVFFLISIVYKNKQDIEI